MERIYHIAQLLDLLTGVKLKTKVCKVPTGVRMKIELYTENYFIHDAVHRTRRWQLFHSIYYNVLSDNSVKLIELMLDETVLHIIDDCAGVLLDDAGTENLRVSMYGAVYSLEHKYNQVEDVDHELLYRIMLTAGQL